MGGGCSRSSSQGPKVGESNLSMNAVSPNKNLEINVAALNGNNKHSTPHSLSRVIGFTVLRAVNTGTDAGSKTNSSALRLNSYWLHEDDDRIDNVINNWKDVELLFLQVPLFKKFRKGKDFCSTDTINNDLTAIFCRGCSTTTCTRTSVQHFHKPKVGTQTHLL